MQTGEKVICPLCKDPVDRLVYRFHIDNERTVIEKIKSEHPAWSAADGLCSRCLDYYHVEIISQQRMLPSIGPYFPVKSADDYVILPTGLRLDADARFTGKGITICFIDSGFSPHPDLTGIKNRIKFVTDITDSPKNRFLSGPGNSERPDPSCWHGTMTSVVCAGDGYLSRGLYKGLACDAELVLLKVLDQEGKITTENICRALEWVLANHRTYGIRIVNLSLGNNETVPFRESRVDQLAETLIAEGIVVVAAVGNDEYAGIHAPANSPNVIAVGGVDDGNLLNDEKNRIYHSSYGRTSDEFMKPELVAHAIWVAAPLVRDTEEQQEAETLYQLLSLSEETLETELEINIRKTKLDSKILEPGDISAKKEIIKKRIQSAKYISPHYMHVDGTSFSAPVVTAVIAQLLEVNPALTPGHIRQLLFSTAKRIKAVPAERQGFGIIQARKAILKVLKKDLIPLPPESPFINRQKKSIELVIYHDHAEQISLAGCFNHWAKDVLLFEPGMNGLWKIEIPLLPNGRYSYKLFVDGRNWMEDIGNPYREPDGFNGFNSLLIVSQSLN